MRTNGSKEVDFIAIIDRSEKILVQVCESITDQKTKERETRALNEAMGELKIDKGIIVTRYEEEVLTLDHGTAEVIPIWKFMLRY